MKIFENIEMKEYSNMKVGGIARELIIIEDKNELKQVLTTRDKVFLLGNGTNTLIPDGKIDMSFITLKGFKDITVEEVTKDYDLVRVEAGLDLDELIKYMEENQEIVQFSLDCYSSICYEKTIWTELFYFENILTFVLTDKIDEESKTDFEIEDIMVNYNKIIEQLPYLK